MQYQAYAPNIFFWALIYHILDSWSTVCGIKKHACKSFEKLAQNNSKALHNVDQQLVLDPVLKNYFWLILGSFERSGKTKHVTGQSASLHWTHGQNWFIFPDSWWCRRCHDNLASHFEHKYPGSTVPVLFWTDQVISGMVSFSIWFTTRSRQLAIGGTV